MNASETNSAKTLSREIMELVERNDYGGRYEQALREFCGHVAHWATARDGSGTYLTYRLPGGRTVRVLGHRVIDAKTRAVRAWAKSAAGCSDL